MSLQERLQNDLKESMKQKDELRTLTLRMILSEIRYARIEKKQDLSDPDVQALISKSIKKHQDSIEMYTKGNREDLAAREEDEKNILLSYLPEQLSEEKIEALVRETVQKTQASGLRDMGKVMQALMPLVKGKADGKLVSTVVQRLLGE
ncbi:MAG TPA: GatB/YqeY domain-containing protein [Firmicutes bacterium]|nr:GatB/YqeY domain-containing protein [Bacillota bacterium]